MNGNDLIRVISFNLKRDFGLPLNRSHKWSERRALAAQYIRESGATIIGVQELLPNMREDVSRLLDVDYSVLGFGRYSGIRPQSDEHSDIIIKNDSAKVNLIKTFWLSKEPEHLSRAYYAIFPRICTVAEIYLKDLGRSIRVFNTHLDHICGIARTLGIRVILGYMERFNEERAADRADGRLQRQAGQPPGPDAPQPARGVPRHPPHRRLLPRRAVGGPQHPPQLQRTGEAGLPADRLHLRLRRV